MKADKREGPIRKLIACSAGVLLVRANAKSGRWGRKDGVIFTPLPHPSPYS